MLKRKIYRYGFKRIFDIFFAILFILLCSCFVWWWVILINLFATKGKPFFCQKRIGYKEKPFYIIKFRTMKPNASQIAPDKLCQQFYDENVTRFGKFLRKTSIDETPQFLNVLVGQMSLIGPRPAMLQGEEELYNLRKNGIPSAYLAKPGITGYSQTHLKRAHNPVSKAFHDCWYVKNLSFILDLKIFLLTILIIFGFNSGR